MFWTGFVRGLKNSFPSIKKLKNMSNIIFYSGRKDGGTLAGIRAQAE